MASTDFSTSSSQLSTAASDDHKRTVDEAFLNKMKSLVERLRLENATLKNSLDVERSGVRALKAQHEATMRNLKTEHRKREELLDKQLRISCKPEKLLDDSLLGNQNVAELKKLASVIQSLKTSNKSLQEKLRVAKTAESARAAELRAQAAKHAALEQAGIKDARAQCHKLLEEIKSKERVIIQLRRESARVAAALEYEQTQRMEGVTSGFNRNIRIDQVKEKTNREDLKTDIQHRKETFYRETPSDGDSAVSSAPSSLSPQPSADMWTCGQCRSANERAAVSARECSRLTDALRDARDQLELMEFRLLELEDAAPDKGARDNLTDSDSGCVSPGSRIKDSASPELKRMDSGYKSPNAPSSPCVPRRNLNVDYKEEFARAQVLADILDKNSEATSDSLKSNPVKEHLEQMILNAGSAEDRGCLEQVLILLYNYQALSSSVSEDECYQIKPKKLYDLRSPKSDADKTQKVIATVTPYSQQSLKGKFESLDNFGDTEVRKPTNLLQESGIFEDVESESKCTQTDNETFEFTGELNTEIQRLNSIREKLEKQGVRHKASIKLQDEKEGLECKCVKLGKRHKQYYERRLKFLEGKISIYEAAQDVRQAKLSQRLQSEFILETRVEELESQLSELHEKYERLEEDCCELEEIENDTRLHWQQLEMDYELCTAQLRDMTEQRECSRAQAERLMADATRRETELKTRETELLSRLRRLERAVPAIIVWNCVQVLGASITAGGERALQYRMTPFSSDTKTLISEVKQQSARRSSEDTAEDMDTVDAPTPTVRKMEKQIVDLIAEKRRIENHTAELKKQLNDRIKQLENELETAQRQITVAECGAGVKKDILENKIDHLQSVILQENKKEKIPADPHLTSRLHDMLQNEEDLKNRIAELEKREGAYLEMLTQADDMWAEMEGGYKKKIEEANEIEGALKGKVSKLEEEKDQWKKNVDPLKKKLSEVEESESSLRIALDKSERDNIMLRSKNATLVNEVSKADGEIKKAEHTCKELDRKFKNEIEQLRKHNNQLSEDIKNQKEYTKKSEATFAGDLECIRRELNRTCKNAAEMEVTNSELKEEVESLEKQLSLTQKALSNCKRKCDEKIKTLSHELSIKTEELEEMRSEAMRQLQSSRIELKPDRTEYIDEGYTICTAVPKKIDYGRMHHSMSYLTSDTKCSCPTLRSQLVGNLIEDLFDRIHNTSDEDLTRLCKDMGMFRGRIENSMETKAKITNYLLMAISKELVRSIGDADAKTDTEEWQRAVSSVTYSVPNLGSDFSSLRLEGNAGVVRGAARLASVSCACAAAKLCAAVPRLADTVKTCQEEVLDHSDVKIMEEQLANAIESIVNCPSCALGTNAIVWSTDV